MRYAIYFAAYSSDPLMQLGNTWLGRNPFSGGDLAQPDVHGLDQKRVHDLTTDPRRYGFHGTLKAPFSLKDGTTQANLIDACSRFATDVTPFELTGLSVNRLGKFLALTPDQPEPALAAFAEGCLRAFEPFRAPLSEADLERRRKANLTSKQDAYVEKWGYPYIFDEFRFHMTLSNKLENEDEAKILKEAAEEHFASVTDNPRTCRHFGLYVEAERGAPFEVQTIFELTGNASPQDFLTRAEASKENA
ncbi:MAG: DUF1045 domain-containing protein [Roseibium sp.]|uniref:DUF1045 domain-containing protein n=1 Tax=Roseibium sp. TaxID=1936156 RepID=UPI0032972ED2